MAYIISTNGEYLVSDPTIRIIPIQQVSTESAETVGISVPVDGQLWPR